ncbi:hypothetical protein [Streptomyces sp. NPDC051569]|uniref:hypothetical protein n=1 Tax=Streptomyces sp. NPDC051569 TaxID=3365661 RepID=UPI0037918766
MAITISLALLLLVFAVIFLRTGGLKLSHATVCVLLGFLLASSSMAPTIANGITATAGVVSSLNP